MTLRFSYTLLAPLYDSIVARASGPMRSRSLQRLTTERDREILIPGIGSGLDIPYLPDGHRYTGLDLTPAMLRRAESRLNDRSDVELRVGDAMALPFAEASFDAVVLHLILAVVPRPQAVLHEVQRVLRPGGRVLILDKFLRPGQWAPMRRLLSPLLGLVATRTDVVFEELLTSCRELTLVSDEPVLADGWFRLIELRKRSG